MEVITLQESFCPTDFTTDMSPAASEVSYIGNSSETIVSFAAQHSVTARCQFYVAASCQSKYWQ